MPAGATTVLAPTTLKAAVRTILGAVTGIGSVGAQLGDEETWLETGGPGAFWTVYLRPDDSLSLEYYAAQRHTDARYVLWIEGVLPWSGDFRSEVTWETLVAAVLNALIVKTDLADTVDDIEPSLPQVRQWGDRPEAYSTTQSTLLVHRCIVELSVSYQFQHAQS